MTKEEEDVNIMHSWMEVGGHPACPEEEAQGLLAEVNAFLCLFPISPSPFYPLFAYLLPIFPSQSFSSFFVGFETAPTGEHQNRRGQKARNRGSEFGDRGVGKLREAILGSEVESFYGLLRGVTLCSHLLLAQPPLSWSHLSPGSPISQQPPQESTGPEVSGPAGQAPMSAPAAATPAPEGDIPADMQPVMIQLGAPNECINARLKVAKRAHQPHRQQFMPMSGRYTWEWGWCAHSAAKPFSIQTSSGITEKLTSKNSL